MLPFASGGRLFRSRHLIVLWNRCRYGRCILRAALVRHEEERCSNIERGKFLTHHLLGTKTVTVEVFLLYRLLYFIEGLEQSADLFEVLVARDEVGLILTFAYRWISRSFQISFAGNESKRAS